MYDEETGFYYLQSRYYNPEIGRFITRDTIADSNMYLYTDNNPVNFVDHDGAFPFPVIFLAIRIGIGAYNAYTTYMSIKNDPSASNILLSLVPGGKIGKTASKKLLSVASKAMKKSKGTSKALDLSNANLSKWNKGSFKSAGDSAIKHFEKHGKEVGAGDVAQYIRKAESFAQNLRGATKSKVSGKVSGVIRYKKNGKYIDLAPNGSKFHLENNR